ncbi:MAG: aminotransferase class III-fold pyridoxal phosphate-dependent enzyme [Candidatus Saganbacteria bacterium]|nr:aminotransferase class III-fold pyridoxal phosphate-dependent enzyme [Candidatus Saganbacteria bacterium]
MNKLLKRFKEVTSPVLGRYFPDFEIKSAKGCYLTATDGKKYLDFSSGIATTVVGHCHPKVVAAAVAQVKKLIHICIGVAIYEPYVKLCEELRKIVPIKDAQPFLCQSGSEAVESAIKLAKYTTKKPGIICFKGCFHGRTLGALSLTTSKMKYRDGYEPLLPEVYVLDWDLAEVEETICEHDIAGVIIEPILGEGGYIEAPAKVLKGLRRLCTKYKVLLIFDEVQTCFGHTGNWFASQALEITPDILTMAKGLASGFPLGACVASSEIMKKWSVGSHGGTYGGNPVCCAASIATIEVIKKEKLLKNTQKLGAYLKKKLIGLKGEFPIIKEVRGMGLMLGVDFKDSAVVKKILTYCLKKQLVLISTGADGTVIRFVPALNVHKKQIDTALSIFAEALKHV